MNLFKLTTVKNDFLRKLTKNDPDINQELTLKTPVKTRWYSVFLCIERYLKIVKHVNCTHELHAR